MFQLKSLVIALGAYVAASPVGQVNSSGNASRSAYADVADWAAGGTPDYTIHRSCNATQTHLLQQALAETVELAAHARDHIYRFGNSSSFYLKYFGKATTAEPAAWLDRIVNADKTGVVFRCDDVDGNCDQAGWAGHWRGANASDETVICDLSFTSRWPLKGVCGYGYTVSNFKTSSYFAGDLMHRLYHTDKIGEGVTGHYADTYQECLALAKDHPEQAVRNSATLRYFALDVYAYDIAVPGEGCTGIPAGPASGDSGHGPASSSTAASSATSATPAPSAAAGVGSGPTPATPVVTGGASVTSAAGTECHTHADGVVHCV